MNEYDLTVKQLLEEMYPYEDFNEDTELIESDILDSLSILYIVAGIEEKYKIIIDEKIINPENFRNIKKIGEIIEKIIGNC